MNEISGQIIHKESGAGIPNLLVVVFDFDPNTRSEDPSTGGTPTVSIALPPDLGIGDRICTLITDRLGQFKVTYENAEFQVRNEQEKRPDLLLMVLAPEDSALDAQSRILYASDTIR